MSLNDTICALATANGTGAIGIIRVSGNDSFKIVNKIFKGKNIENVPSHTLHYGWIYDMQNGEKELIDEVMLYYRKFCGNFVPWLSLYWQENFRNFDKKWSEDG